MMSVVYYCWPHEVPVRALRISSLVSCSVSDGRHVGRENEMGWKVSPNILGFLSRGRMLLDRITAGSGLDCQVSGVKSVPLVFKIDMVRSLSLAH